MGTRKEGQPVGSLKISQDVIATIVRVATLEVEGVDSLVEPGGKSGVMGKFFGKKPIKISLSDDFAEVEIGVRLKFGAQITPVCTRIQQAVKENIQTMTGMAVSTVNVLVEGISFPEEKAGQ